MCERVCTSDRLLRRLGKLAKVRTRGAGQLRDRIGAAPSAGGPACRSGRMWLLWWVAAVSTAGHGPHVAACPVAARPQDPTRNSCITVCGTSRAGGHACQLSAAPAAGAAGPGAARQQRLGLAAWSHSCVAPTAPESPTPRCTPRPPPLPPPLPLPAHDACVEACQRSVCSIPHQVPAWNEACLKRCTAECMKGRAA